MENNFDYTKKVTQHIVDGLQIDFLQSVNGGFKFHNDREPYTLQSLHTYIHPYVSNGMFEREKQIVQRENLRTIVKLAQSPELDDETLKTIINRLGYQVVQDKNQVI